MKSQNSNYHTRTVTAILGCLFVFGMAMIWGSQYLRAYSEFWADILRDTGIVFVPINALALIQRYLSDRDSEDLIRDCFDEAAKQSIEPLTTKIEGLSSSVRQTQQQIASDLGKLNFPSCVRRVYPERPELEPILTQAKSQIDILTTNFFHLLNLDRALTRCLERGVKVRLVGLSTDSVFLDERYEEAHFPSREAMALEFNNSLLGMNSIVEKSRQRFPENPLQLRVHFGLPALFLYRVDSVIIVGFLPAQGRSREHIHIEMFCGPEDLAGCTNDFLVHFDTVWQKSKPFDPGLLS